MNNKRMVLIMAPPLWPKMPPMGLGYLQSFLIASGIGCDILDLNNIFYNLSSSELKKSWLISCNTCLEENILDLIQKSYPEEFKRLLDQILQYEIAGLSCYKSNINSALRLARLIKSRDRNIKIIFGGPEITRQFFKTSGRFTKDIKNLVDFIITGEGEKSLLNYIKKPPLKTKTTLFSELDNLDKLPFPVYRGLDINSYPRKNSIPILFSRGCIKKCGFCSERLLYKKFRLRPVESMIEEIRYHKSKNKIEYFVFHDSLINANLKQLEKLCDKIIDNFGLIKWEAQIAVRNDMHYALMEKMKKSGCYNLFIGFESGCDKTLKKMNKGFTIKDAVSFFKKLNNAGLFFGVSIIIGYPGETESDFLESLDFIIKNKSLIPKIEQINPFTYYEGTNVEKCADKDALKRFNTFIREIKSHGLKYTNAFLGNLIEK